MKERIGSMIAFVVTKNGERQQTSIDYKQFATEFIAQLREDPELRELLRTTPKDEVARNLTLDETCERLGLGRSSIYRLIRQGILIRHKAGKKVQVQSWYEVDEDTSPPAQSGAIFGFIVHCLIDELI